jgi:hypothetical protein
MAKLPADVSGQDLRRALQTVGLFSRINVRATCIFARSCCTSGAPTRSVFRCRLARLQTQEILFPTVMNRRHYQQVDTISVMTKN